MPNRILKESICRSEEIDSLSWFEEVLFYRLIVVCDDFGRYDGRAKIIKGSCFPLKDVTEKNINEALDKLSTVGLVRVYETQGRPYLQLVTWAAHQRIRNQKSKYPEFTSDCNLLSFDSKSQQMETSGSRCVRNPIQSESNNNNIIVAPAGNEPNDTPDDMQEKYPIGNFEYQCVDILIRSCVAVFPNSKVPETAAEKKKWAMEIERMKRLDGRSESDIIEALTYATTDGFWKSNIRSAKKFREKFETLIIQSRSRQGKNFRNGFNQFPQNDYDIQALERELVENGGDPG